MKDYKRLDQLLSYKKQTEWELEAIRLQIQEAETALDRLKERAGFLRRALDNVRFDIENELKAD